MTKSIKKMLLILSFFSIPTISKANVFDDIARPFETHKSVSYVSAVNTMVEPRHFTGIVIKKQEMNTTTGAGGGEINLWEGQGQGPVVIYLGSWITPITNRIKDKNEAQGRYLIRIEMKQYQGKYYATFTVGNADESFYLEKYIVSWTPSTRKNPSQEKSIPCEATPLTSGLVYTPYGNWQSQKVKDDGIVTLTVVEN